MALVVTNQFVSSKALMKFFRHVWAKKGGLELKVPSQMNFVFYFEEIEDLKLVFSSAPCN